MNADWLSVLAGDENQGAIVDFLDNSPFDELVEIDLINDHCRNIYHIEGKYFVPVVEGGWLDMYRYATEHMVHPDDSHIYSKFMDPDTMPERFTSARVPGVLQAEFRYRLLDGDWLWTRQILVSGSEHGLADGIVRCYIFDIQRQKDRAAGRISATYSSVGSVQRDNRTGLVLEKDFFEIARGKLDGLSGKWCVIAIDIEHFKLFVEWHGQETGSFLLAEIGEKLQAVERATGGLAGYFGHDDFCLLAPYDLPQIDKLYEDLRNLIVSHGDTVGFLPIFGIGIIGEHSDQILDVYNHAAMTAEQVKGDFRNRVCVYDPGMHDKTAEEYRLLAEFQRGLENREIFFCLQPQCRVSTGRVVGAESLARWRLPDGRMVPPGVFVPVLEKYGIVTNLDKFIWEEVCVWLRRWLDAGRKAVPVSVNVSQIDIFTIDVPAHFDALLQKYRLPASLIKVEITESAYVDDTAVVRDTVRRLRDLGCLVMMDDFGSGFSSLNMLSSLNVDVIKLDAQFLRIQEQEARKGISILESIISMAKTMSMPVIVEGVETQEQINFLSNLGCRYMQGYYFYRPMPVEEFEALIADERRLDLRGFVVKANEQMHAREFMDENVFSDAMLNNILGPVAIYRWDGENVDIIRYNQQFYRMVGIENDQLDDRRRGILDYYYPDDREKMFHLLERAATDRMNGAEGVVRVYKPNGALHWISLKLYFMEENESGMVFYGACQDVTEMQFVNVDLPGGYHRCTVEGGFEFQYISQGFQDMTGYSKQEIQEQFDNKFVNMVHPKDVHILMERAEAIVHDGTVTTQPYRLKRKGGGWIYVVNQSLVTDLYGQLCFMSVAIDVSELMKLRNQMRLLARFSSDSIVFLSRRASGGWKYRVVAHGLQDKLGMKPKAFERALNDGSFYGSIEEPSRSRLMEVTTESLARQESFDFVFRVNLPGGEKLKLHLKTDYVNDDHSKVEYICVFRAE